MVWQGLYGGDGIDVDMFGHAAGFIDVIALPGDEIVVGGARRWKDLLGFNYGWLLRISPTGEVL